MLVAALLSTARGIVTDEVGAALEFPATFSSTSSTVSASLELSRYMYRGPSGLQQWTRTFNGEMVGPTLRIKPGDTLTVGLRNQWA
jgi:FtsP/CotA-like multicopper oxidase with cupredoxin domain